MGMMTLDLPPEIYEKLEEEARKTGKTPEALTQELLATILGIRDGSGTGAIRNVLQTAGRLSSLNESVKRRIIPGVTIDEVREALKGPPDLSKLVSEQRGPKP